MSKTILTIFLYIAVILISNDLIAQCPMCRMAAESNLDQGGTEGRGLNTGILYLFSMPYLIAGVLGFLWWKNKVKDTDEVAG